MTLEELRSLEKHVDHLYVKLSGFQTAYDKAKIKSDIKRFEERISLYYKNNGGIKAESEDPFYGFK